MIRRSAATALLLILALSQADAQSLPVRLDVGYSHTEASGRLFYRLEYRKAVLSKQGAPFAETPVGDAPQPRNLSGRGDDFSLVLERDQTRLDGALFDALGLRDFRVPALRNVRLVGGLAGRFGEAQRLSLGFGLESVPIHPLGIGAVSNYAMLGLLGESLYRDASEGGNEDAVSATYRVFAGISGGRVLTRERVLKRDDLAARVEAGEFPFERWPQEARRNRDPEVRAILSLAIADFGGQPDEARPNLLRVVRAYYVPDQPSLALWFEGEGAYRLDAAEGPRYRDTIALSANWWPAPETPERLRVQMRYENGFRRADPTRRSTGWQVTLGFAF
ncbi:MAG: hypothetical protein M9921_00730 [Fimbriimonadaceae bacterium]|nr:hypothetical protein [Fimbriimonadaceae bacterium]